MPAAGHSGARVEAKPFGQVFSVENRRQSRVLALGGGHQPQMRALPHETQNARVSQSRYTRIYTCSITFFRRIPFDATPLLSTSRAPYARIPTAALRCTRWRILRTSLLRTPAASA